MELNGIPIEPISFDIEAIIEDTMNKDCLGSIDLGQGGVVFKGKFSDSTEETVKIKPEKFSIGDIVECVDATHEMAEADELMEGKTYTVASYWYHHKHGPCYRVRGGGYSVPAACFELKPETFKVGDTVECINIDDKWAVKGNYVIGDKYTVSDLHSIDYVIQTRELKYWIEKTCFKLAEVRTIAPELQVVINQLEKGDMVVSGFTNRPLNAALGMRTIGTFSRANLKEIKTEACREQSTSDINAEKTTVLKLIVSKIDKFLVTSSKPTFDYQKLCEGAKKNSKFVECIKDAEAGYLPPTGLHFSYDSERIKVSNLGGSYLDKLRIDCVRKAKETSYFKPYYDFIVEVIDDYRSNPENWE